MKKMERPHNILNSAPDANPRTNTQIKTLVFWWSGLTLLYLWSGLKISEGSSFLGIKFEKPSEQTFEPTLLAVLWILNFVFLVRLIWRIYISMRYNRYYDKAVRKIVCNGGYAEEYIQTPYEKEMRCFNGREKWVVGFTIPILMGLVAMECLSNRLLLYCYPWLKTALCLEIITCIFWIIAVVAVLSILCCEYRRETALQKFLEEKKNPHKPIYVRDPDLRGWRL